MVRHSFFSSSGAASHSLQTQLRLVGDIGGTNVRLALADLSGPVPQLENYESFADTAFENFEDAVKHYLKDTGKQPGSAVIAVAGPIEHGKARLTNGRWSFSEAALVEAGFASAKLINDFVALALSVEHLGENDLGTIGPAPAAGLRETVGIVGAGTGLGVGAVVRQNGAVAVAATEGGHMSFAPTDETEIEILRLLMQRFGRVSLERVLSGPGLTNLRWALGRIKGVEPGPLTPEEIVRLALSDADSLCVQTLDRFCGLYGQIAGDIALAFGATGGVFLGGGIAPKLIDKLRASNFRQRFEAKGRLSHYVASIPTQVILHPYAALLGAANVAL